LRVEGWGLRVEGWGLRVEGWGLRVEGWGLRVEGWGFRCGWVLFECVAHLKAVLVLSIDDREEEGEAAPEDTAFSAHAAPMRRAL